MFSFAKVQVLLNVASSSPRTLIVNLEGEDSVEVEVQYESIPCSKCLSASHLSTKCPFRMKPGLLKTPAQAAVLIAPTTSEDLGSEEGASLQVSSAPESTILTNSGDSRSVSDLEVSPQDQGNWIL